ncbi:hypothetical protein [Anaerovorax odorimutans]|uniref:hypothetical protein n=1 Tax=Anaerovorax odorimutans TaxID=109327 RepID=UPI0004053512|nr:hypothetical protein [Anaerovorax odorimutans]
MIQAISNYYNTNEKYSISSKETLNSITSTEDEEGKVTADKQSLPIEQAITRKTDSIEISDAGLNSLMSNLSSQNDSEEDLNINSSSVTQTDSALNNSEIIEQSTSSSTEDDDSSTINLSTLTEEEIQELVSEQVISQAEANTELARREQESKIEGSNIKQITIEAKTTYESTMAQDPLGINQTGLIFDKTA